MKVIVSVTTTKSRMGIFFYSLQSLRKQNYNNFQININLSKESYLFDDGIHIVPDWMSAENAQVNFVKNTGSYRKLLPLIEEVDDDDVIVTADDDVLYSTYWLKSVIEGVNQYPDALVCGGARRIKRNFLGRIQNYSNWPYCVDRDTAMDLLPIGCHGVAYRKKLLDLEFLTDEAFLDCAPTADDIWFRLASIRKNTRVHVDPELQKGNAYIRHKMGLEEINIYRFDPRRRLHRKAANRLKLELYNYFGLSISKNDLAWRAASKFSKYLDNEQ